MAANTLDAQAFIDMVRRLPPAPRRMRFGVSFVFLPDRAIPVIHEDVDWYLVHPADVARLRALNAANAPALAGAVFPEPFGGILGVEVVYLDAEDQRTLRNRLCDALALAAGLSPP